MDSVSGHIVGFFYLSRGWGKHKRTLAVFNRIFFELSASWVFIYPQKKRESWKKEMSWLLRHGLGPDPTARTCQLFWGISLILKLCLHLWLPCSFRLFDSGEEPVEPSEEDKPDDASPQPTGQSYAATVALPSSPPASATLMGTLALTMTWNLVKFRSKIQTFCYSQTIREILRLFPQI